MKSPFAIHLLAALAIPPLCHAQPAQVPQQINYQGRVSVQGVNFTGTGQFKFALVDAGSNVSQTATAVPVIGGLGDGMGPRVLSITMTNGGAGYVDPPIVTINADQGSGATAEAVLGVGGIVTGITVTNYGLGYTGTTTVTIAPPPENIATTTYWSNDGTSTSGGEPTSAVSLPVSGGLYSVALGNTTFPNMSEALLPAYFEHSSVRLRIWFDDGTHGFQLLTPDQPLVTVPYAFHADTARIVPDGSITGAQLADGAVSSGKIAPGAVQADRLVISGVASSGKVLGYGDGGSLTWVTPSSGGGGGISLPFNNSFSDPTSVLGLSNDNGNGIYGETGAIGKSGVFGRNDVGLTIFNQDAGQGVYGYGSHIAVGVLGVSEGNDGISGRTNHAGKSGVFGYSSASQANGVAGISDNGAGVFARTNGANQSAIYAYTAASNSWAVNAVSTQNNAIVGTTNNASAAAIYAKNTAVNGLGLYVEGNATVAGKLTSTSDVIANGSGNLQAYMGGDNNGDVEFGSKNAAVTTAAFYNPTSGQFLNTIMRDASVRKLTITGGADLAEPFAIGEEALPKGSLVVIDDALPGQLRRSTQEYDTRVAGIVSGANGINPGIALHQDGVNEHGQQVALTGRVYCLADASTGPIKPGDLLTTSATPGHAMKVTDHARSQGAVIGKAMSALDAGSGYVLVLVTLQ